MEKQYFYEFQGRIFVKAEDQDQVENLVTDIPLADYLIDEDVYAVDENYIPVDLKQRQEHLGTNFHPLDDPDNYENFKMRESRYGDIFNDFLNGKFDKDELLKRMTEADKKVIDDGDLVYSITMVDIDSKKEKTARLVPVD